MLDFISLVRDMRKAQRDYFKTRSKDNLKKSIALEKQVNAFLNHIESKKGGDD